RLPIEGISRASANQRAGRCGRIAPGTCIRLYSEEDYLSRPEYTDPEILRTNLASVILQMAAIGLGDIETFPFLQPPDRRSVADGRALLEELGAFRVGHAPPRLSGVGRRLARLPLDPRLGRMVIEAERRGCLREVTIIAAALSVQDPRERPTDQSKEADEAHRRFEVAGSDFLGYVRLWDYIAEIQGGLSGNQFRRRCRSEYLNVLRIREWQDVAGQIRQVHRAEGAHTNREPATSDQVHMALLAGLLSHVGMRDRGHGDYLGARTTRWRIGRGSSVARGQPSWAMAAALVETGATWARTVARIDPAWAEQIGAHLVMRSHSEPWWDPKRGEAMAAERVTLYGLPVVAGREVGYSRIDQVAARDLFIRHALVERDWPPSIPALERVAERIETIRRLEDRVRRRDLLADAEALYSSYTARIPSDITSGPRFLRWWRQADPDLLEVPLRALLDPDAGRLDLSGYPDRWEQGDVALRLRYRYAPGRPGDGLTVEVPIAVLNRIDSDELGWNVPGYRAELVASLVRMLPKPVRRNLGPAPDVARSVVDGLGPPKGPLLPAVARALSRLSGEKVDPGVWDRSVIPEHLRVTFDVIDDDRRLLARGRDFERLRADLRHELRAAVQATAPELARRGATSWDWGDLPQTVRRGDIHGFPAIVDEGQAVGIAVLEDEASQADAMWSGTRRLLLLRTPLPAAHLQRRLTNDTKLALARSGRSMAELMDDCARAAADEILLAHGGPAFAAAGYERIEGDAHARLQDRVVALATMAGGVLAAEEAVQDRASTLARHDRAGVLDTVLADVRAQASQLAGPGFVSETGARRLPDLLRYLKAAQRRLDLLPSDARRDRERQTVVARAIGSYEARLDDLASGRLAPGAAARLADVRWMIEELRVSLWAQELGTAGPISEARISGALGEIAG
ncbi:MAG: ATP-dependent RNA helicase HrpA, partial [Acidimicrobiales bacterium]|nr:ATP-dependent RNA helicase HrpA [Acidimicrobiales bacterium]